MSHPYLVGRLCADHSCFSGTMSGSASREGRLSGMGGPWSMSDTDESVGALPLRASRRIDRAARRRLSSSASWRNAITMAAGKNMPPMIHHKTRSRPFLPASQLAIHPKTTKCSADPTNTETSEMPPMNGFLAHEKREH